MKSLTSTPTGNIVPTVNYSAGSYTLTGLVVGTNYYYSMGTNDTSIAFSGGATFAKSATATGVFTATATSATLAGSGTSAVGTLVYPIYGIPLYPTTVTPSIPLRQITIGQYTTANPNWVRNIQVSDQYVFVKKSTTAAVAITLADLVNIAMTTDVGLTWTPPVVTTQPSSTSCTRGGASVNIAAVTGSEYTQTYQWQYSLNNSSWTNITGNVTSSSTTVTLTNYTTATLTASASGGTLTAIYFRLVATDNAGSYGLTNGSVTTIPATLTIS